MPKIVKSISLDERTAPIANNKTNFSAWVREKLLEDIEYSIPCSYYPLHHMDGITGKQLFIEIKDENGRVSKKPKITKKNRIGNNQNFFLTLKNSQNSFKKLFIST